MKAILLLLLLFGNIVAFGQKDTVALKENVRRLDAALLSKDSVELVKLLDDEVTFGHSNGWVESKADVFRDLRTGNLVYEKIETSDVRINGDNDWASVRLIVNVKGTVNTKGFEMKLHVLQVWKRVKGEWRLIARQSTKI